MRIRNCLAVGFACLLMPCLSQAEPLSIEIFARNSDYQGVKVSPHGRFLAALAPHGDQNALVIIDRTEMKVTGSIRLEQNQDIGDFYWANNDRIVAKILSRQSADDRLADYGEIFAMDADGGSKKLIYGYRVSEMSTGSKIKKSGAERASAAILDPLHNDKKHILIASYPFTSSEESRPTVLKLNVNRGTTVKLTRTPIVDATLMHSKDLRLWATVGQDLKGRNRVLWRDEDSIDWAPLIEAAKLDEQIDLLALDSAERSLWALSDITTPTRSLVKIKLDTGEIEPLLNDPRYDVAWAVYDKDDATVLGVCYEADRPRCEYLDPSHPTSRVHASLQQAFPEQFVSIVNWTSDGSEAVLQVWGDRNPGDYFIFDAVNKKVDFLLSSRQWIDPNLMSRKTPIAFKSRDGVDIEGYLTRHPASEGPLPMVVLVHGGPHGPRDYWSFDGEEQMLANRGYSVLQVNFRGSGGFGKDFKRAGYRNWGTTIQDDITDGVHWAIEHGHADPARICIYGASFGGYSAIMSATREPDLYRCAIGNVGVYDMDLMFTSGDIPDSRGGPEYLELVLGVDEQGHRAQSPLHHVSNIKADLMIAYGKQDDRAPPIQSTRLIKALDDAGKSYELMVTRREGHGIANESTRLAYFEKVINFLDSRTAVPRAAGTP